MTVTLPNFIIGGTGRAGTTSLFRYLSAHPDVCASKKKELMFFNTYQDKAEQHLEEYSSYFSHCAPSHKIIMEATPHYILSGEAIAPIIARTLPNIKILFMLREPTERLFTVYRNEKNIDDKHLSLLSFDDFVDMAISSTNKVDKSKLESRLHYYLLTGCYARQLTHYFNNFDAGQIQVCFFDQFKSDPYIFICEVCQFLNLDPSFFRTYDFTIENKTRSYKNVVLHKIAYLVNHVLEKMLNNAPKARQILRSFYFRINEKKNSMPYMSDYARCALTSFYRPHNQELRELLNIQNTNAILPDWVR